MYSSINSISSSLSSLNLFIATIIGKLYKDTFDICLPKFSTPIFKLPLPWCFRALTVATITTISGVIFAVLHFISKNFSAPKSAANPASVIV